MVNHYVARNFRSLLAKFNRGFTPNFLGRFSFAGGNFNCQGNPGNFTEADVRAVCDVKGEVLIGSGL